MNFSKPLSHKSLLIVEDEPLIAIMIEDVVDGLGCAVRYTAGSQAEALGIIATERLDLAILDVNLGEHIIDFAVAEALLERSIPFVFSSGHIASDLPMRFRGVPFLSKPYGEEELSAALQMLEVN